MLKPKSGRLALTGAMAAAILGGAAIVGGCGSQAAAPAAAIVRPGPESIFEPKTVLFSDPVATLDLMRRLGVDRVKMYIGWRTVAPNAGSRVKPSFDAGNPAAYPASAWSTYDTIVRDAASRGVALYVAVGGLAPLWATQPDPAPGGPYGGAQWKPSAADFALFVRAVGTRYSGHYTPPGASSPLPRVSFWGIWNEPNLGSANLAPQAIDHSTIETSPALYRGLVDAAWGALQATGHGDDTILIGELAPYGQIGPDNPGDYGEMVPMRFVRAFYCVAANGQPLEGTAAAARACPADPHRFAAEHPALFHATGFAIHPYPPESGGGLPPGVPALGSPDFVNLATIGQLQRFLDAATATYGVSRSFPIYITEFGYFTNPPYAGGTPPVRAASYLNQAEYLAWLNPRIRSFDQYLLIDPPAGSRSSFVSGLEFAGGAKKPSFDAYRLPIFLPVTSAGRGQSLEVWGCIRPAHYVEAAARRTQHARIELQSGPGQPFATVATVTSVNAHGYFDVRVRFATSGSVRLAWSYPHGPAIYSRSVAITVS
jgi:hypothetical protein